MSIGSRIKEARKQQNMTQEELAEKLHITKGAIANYENQVSTPKIEILLNIMDILKVDANYLYQDDISTKSDTSDFVDAQKEKLFFNYDRLNAEGREKLVDYSDDLINTGKYKKPSKPKVDMEASEELA